MPDNCPEDKRKSVRFLITIPLKYEKLDVECLDSKYTHDISSHGVGVISAEKLPLNTPIILCLKIPDNDEEIILEAEAVWSTQVADSMYRSGLKLKNPPIKPIPLVLRTIYSRL
ncbi:MAG: PilZ domain-containing protein [Candidatus Omnitrophota bacterium]